jgi:tungstate transport system permease protein
MDALIPATCAISYFSVHYAKSHIIMTQRSMLTSDNAFSTALALILSMDSALISIVMLSLQVSLMAVFIASLLALPLGAALALWRFPGRNVLIIALNALMGLPPVVAGLCVYLLLSRAGPLGGWGLLFTPTAMVIAQVILVLPIIAALTRQQV